MSGLQVRTILLLSLALLPACGSGANEGFPPAEAPAATPSPVRPPSPAPGPQAGPLTYFASVGPFVLRSEDVGETWGPVLPFPARIEAIDADHVWAWHEGILLESRDGGRTWASRVSRIRGRPARFEFVGFADRQRGVLVATDAGRTPPRARLFHTDDAGATWALTQEIEDFRPRSCMGDDGFVATYFDLGLLVSHDAGATWTDRSDTLPEEYRGWWRIACAGSSDLWLLSDAGIFASDDAGRSWSPVDVPRVGEQSAVVRDIALSSPGTGWAVFAGLGEGTSLYRTTSGGLSWELVLEAPDESWSFPSVNFEDDEHGAVGAGMRYFSHPLFPSPAQSRPVTWVTDDGGSTWTRTEINPLFPPSILGRPEMSVALPGEPAAPIPPRQDEPGPILLLSTRNGGIHRSPDGGASWEESFHISLQDQEFGFSYRPLVHSVQLLDRDHGWAAGERGLVLETFDGGRTWRDRSSAVPSAPAPALLEVRFFDATHGVIGATDDPSSTGEGRRPFFYWTDDGGRTWGTASIDTTPGGVPFNPSIDYRAPRNICFTESGLALSADYYSNRFQSQGNIDTIENSFVLISEDLGQSWYDVRDAVPAPAHFHIRQVACAGESDLWLFGAYQSIPLDPAVPVTFYSGDGGLTWTKVSAPLPEEMSVGRSVSSAVFPSTSEGWIAAGPISDWLVVRRTMDGGETWRELLRPPEPVFDAAVLQVVDSDTAIVAASEARRILNRQPVVFLTQDGGETWDAFGFPNAVRSRAVLDLAAAP